MGADADMAGPPALLVAVYAAASAICHEFVAPLLLPARRANLTLLVVLDELNGD